MTADNKLKVTLSPADMRELDIEDGGIRQGSGPAKQVLLALLERGREETGFHPRGSKLVVEVFPHEDGGCVVCFTALANQSFSPGGRAPVPVVFEFAELDAALEAGGRAFALYAHRIHRSGFYRMEERGAYRLIVYPLDYTDRLSVYFLSEYGRKVGEGELPAAFTREHGREILPEGALDVLAAYFRLTKQD